VRYLLLFVALSSVPVIASAMPVSTSLQKANALKAKGPLAAFSSDVGLLKRQVQQDGEQLKAENKALEAAGKRKHYCAREGSALTLKDLMAAVNAVPVPERSRTSTKEAFRNYIALRHPCRS
jgi:hypothetical protein